MRSKTTSESIRERSHLVKRLRDRLNGAKFPQDLLCIPLTLRPVRSDAKMKLISKCPLFTGLSHRELHRVAGIADEVNLKADKVLIREGDRGREFFVLIEGEARVSRKGKKVATLRGGDFFGEVSLVSNQPRTATVTTSTPARALVVNDRDFQSLIKDSPAIAVKVLSALADRLPPSSL